VIISSKVIVQEEEKSEILINKFEATSKQSLKDRVVLWFVMIVEINSQF
jgi:hypothetical protein